MASSSTVGVINPGGDSESLYPTEWIFPNSGDGKYLTSAQCRVYIGDLFIDELDTIYYNYSNNRIPIYGYSSADPDAFGQGRRLVQGQLALNFVSTGYLYTVVSEYSSKYSVSKANTNDAAITNLADLYKQKAAAYALIAKGDNSSGTLQSVTSLTQQITQAHAKLGSSSVAAVKKVLANESTATTNVNAIKKEVAFDIVIKSTGGGRTITREIRKCVLTTNEQVWDQSDNSIKDVYGFMGVELI